MIAAKAAEQTAAPPSSSLADGCSTAESSCPEVHDSVMIHLSSKDAHVICKQDHEAEDQLLLAHISTCGDDVRDIHGETHVANTPDYEPVTEIPIDKVTTGTVLVGILFLGATLGLTALMHRPAILPYCALQLGIALLGFRVRDWDWKYRWITGLLCVVTLSGYKVAILMRMLTGNATLGIRMFFFGTTALWECSNSSLVFGGAETQRKFGITSYTRAFIKAWAPCQVKFVNSSRPALLWRRCWHLLALFTVGIGLQQVLKWSGEGVLGTISSIPILEAEVLAILLFATTLFFNVPGLVWQFVMNAVHTVSGDHLCRVEIILPYGAIYFSTSTREFWSKWSRPASSLIRQMFYYPLGGPQRPYISIPVMFALNAAAHYDVSNALVGDRAIMWWNLVFGVLGVAATCEIMATKWMIPQTSHSAETAEAAEDFPLWFKVGRGAIAHASLRVALYFLVTRCLQMNVSSFLLSL